MKSIYHAQIRRVVQVTEFSSGRYAWFGRFGPGMPPSIRRAVSPQMREKHLLSTLQQQLYTHFYCPGTAVALRQARQPTPAGSEAFVKALSRANAGQERDDPGWRPSAPEGGRPVVAHAIDGLKLWVSTDKQEIAPDEPPAQTTLRLPPEMTGASPGFYTAVSEAPLHGVDRGAVFRLYWNLSPRGAVSFLRAATSVLNGSGLPFTVKVVNDPQRFDRRDTVVLYMRRRDREEAMGPLAEIYRVVRSSLRDGRPALTGPVEPGVGVAEDPGGGHSFGWHRCGLIAEGLVRGARARLTPTEQRLGLVEQRLAEDGVRLDAPFSRADTATSYRFRLTALSAGPKATAPRPSSGHVHRDDLRTAYEIGRRLTRQALWWHGRCTWVGAEAKRADADPGSRSPWTTLGAELYDGTTGVALFLGELYAATGDPEFHRTALGATRHAFADADRSLPPTRWGLYSGWAGLALGSARLGLLVNDSSLMEQASGLLERLRHGRRDGGPYDIVSGRAGSVVSLLALHELLRDEQIVQTAVDIGDELLAAAEIASEGISWRSPWSTYSRNLTGYAHGASGVAHALLELFRSTRDPTYAEGAEAAIAFERSRFDAVVGNWSDLRHRRGYISDDRRFMTTWCHGAPGIALTRLRAHELLRTESSREEAHVALGTTREATRRWLEAGSGSFCLCHGLSGNAEVLVEGGRALGVDGDRTPERVARRSEQAWESSGHRWAYGPDSEESPSLMLGLAGIGYFHLRLYDPTIPSLLFLRPEAMLPTAPDS